MRPAGQNVSDVGIKSPDGCGEADGFLLSPLTAGKEGMNSAFFSYIKS